MLAQAYPPGAIAGVTAIADLTGDAHADVLVSALQGSGGCGPWKVFATVRDRVRTIFNHNTCEWNVRLKHGDVVVKAPIGPCPFRGGSVHCFGGTRTDVWHWNGRKLVVVRSRVVCYRTLDPRSNCSRKRVR